MSRDRFFGGYGSSEAGKRAIRDAVQASKSTPGIILPGDGVRDANVEFVCPECGGESGDLYSRLRVETCMVCLGTGRVDNQRLTWYMSTLNVQAREQERRDGTAR